MDDQVLVRVMHGGADCAEELQAIGDGYVPVVAVIVQRLALDVFEDEVGNAVLGRSAVEQPGDVRVIQARQDLPLVTEALPDGVRVHAPLDQLNGHLLAILIIRPVGQVDRAHAAPADLT